MYKYKNILKTFSLYVLYFILIVACIYIFYKLISNNFFKIKIQENYQQPPEGEVITLGDNHIMSIGNNNINSSATFKYNTATGEYQPSYNFRNYSEESQNNYYFFNRKLSENKSIEMTDGDTINLFIDYFDDIYDGENDRFNSSFIDSLLGLGYYVGNGDHPHYFLTFRYLLSKLISFGIYPSTFDEEYEQVKKICGFLCKKLNYCCVLCPKFDSNYIESYQEWMFFVLIKQKSTRIKGSTSTSENNPNADLVNAGNIAFKGLQYITQSSEYQNSPISEVTPTGLVMNANPVTNGILFYLGNSSNDITGINSINSITINETGLQMIICDKDQISNDSNTGLIRDDTYLNSLTSVDKYFNSFKKELFIQYNDYYRVNSIPNPENEETNERTSALVLQRQNFWFFTWTVPIFIDNTQTSLNSDNTSGYEHRFGNDSDSYTWRTQDKGLKGISSVTGWNWSPDGRSFGTSNQTTVSTEYFPKSDSINSCRNPKPFTFQQNGNNSYNIEIPPSQPESGEYELGIDTKKGTVYYNRANKTPQILFTIEKYGLRPEHLVTDYSWPDVKLNKGTLKKGDVLGVNGGNNEYVMDQEKKMRFWFDMHGTLHVEVSLSRKRKYIDPLLNAFQQKFNELFFFYQEERYSNNKYLNLLNYSGTPLTSKGAIMLLLMFSETNVSYSNNTNPVDTLLGKETEEDEDLTLFYKKIGDSEWSKNTNIGINSQDCKNWFKQSDVYEDTIDFGTDFPIRGLNNNSQPISVNQSSLKTALDECSYNPDCYAVSSQPDSNIHKLWSKDEIKKNYGTTPTYTNKTSDIYYKGCPRQTEILKDAQFQQNNGMPFSKTGVIIQSGEGDSNGYSQGREQPITSEYIDTKDIDNNVIINYYITDNNIQKWSPVFVNNGKQPNTMNQDEKINFILDKINRYKDLIKIYSSHQTNRPTFQQKLTNEINTKILTREYLNRIIESTTRELGTNLVNNNNLVANNATKVVKTTRATLPESFSNLNDDYNNDNDIMNKISDKIIKKIVYNIDDIEFTNKFDDYNNINFINSIILSIFLIILVIVFFNIKNKK